MKLTSERARQIAALPCAPGKKRGRPTREEACAKLNEEARAWSAKVKGDARLRRSCPSAQESES